MAIPVTPSNVIIQQGNGQVYLTWNSVAGATTYSVQRSTDNATWTTLTSSITVPNYLDTTGTLNTLYYYQVAATNASGTSSYAASASITPTIAGVMALGQLRTLAQQRADMQNSQFITSDEWNSYINQSAFELYDLLIEAYEEYYVHSPVLISTDGTTFQYQLPDGSTTFKDANLATITPSPFYKLLGVDVGVANSSNAWVTIHKFDFISRNRYVFPQLTSTYLGLFNLRYRVVGNTLYMIPTPSSGQYLRLWYIPRMTQMLRDSDTADGLSGWTEYVIVDAAIKARIKQEKPIDDLMVQKQALLDRIEAAKQNRDAGQPDTISDVRSFSERWGGYGSPNGDGAFGGY